MRGCERERERERERETCVRESVGLQKSHRAKDTDTDDKIKNTCIYIEREREK